MAKIIKSSSVKKKAAKNVPCGTWSAVIAEQKDAKSVGSNSIFGIVLKFDNGDEIQISSSQIQDSDLFVHIKHNLGIK